jgi:SAM-dependent methyltransferase
MRATAGLRYTQGMKLRDSGMPNETYWESLLDVPLILSALGIDNRLRDVAEFGCGYGTFTVPIARAIAGSLYTFDIEPAMVARTQERLAAAGRANVICRQFDVMEKGFDVPAPVDAALLFNVLHCEMPEKLLGHATEAVRVGGQVLVIHWRHDQRTPRGPSLDIRPKPEQIVRWAEQEEKLVRHGDTMDLPPWHFGLRFVRV